MEQRERETIANAFETYGRWYGKESANEVKELVGGDPSDFAKDPKWHSYSERTKVGPLKEDPIQMDIEHVSGPRRSSLHSCENLTVYVHASVNLPSGSGRCNHSEQGNSNHESVSLPSGSSRCDLSSQGAPDIGELPAAAAKADSIPAAGQNEYVSPQKERVLAKHETSLEAEHLLAITTKNSTSTKDEENQAEQNDGHSKNSRGRKDDEASLARPVNLLSTWDRRAPCFFSFRLFSQKKWT
jgi:hypothetical protein